MWLKKNNQKNKILFVVVVLITLFISIGYALLGQELITTGVTNFDNASWSIHFVGNPIDSFSEANGSVVGTHSYSSNYKSLSFSDSLSIPGDYYEFTVDITNDGNIDGMLNAVPNIGIVDNKGTSDISDDVVYTNTNLIKASVTYDDGSPLSQYDELKIGNDLTYKIRIEFKKDIQNSDLVNLPLHLTFTLEPVFVQADSNAKNAGTIINTSNDCNNNTLSSTVPSSLKGLAKIIANQAYLDNSKSEFVSSCNGVDFGNISSDTNGKGVYEIASTKDDTYPIYYYRGAVTNNNVLFANFCWKAVRTTDTGGVKLIYNGVPDESGHCTNTTGDGTQIGKSKFYTAANSLSDIGYMYGTRYVTYSNGGSLSTGINTYIFGNDVTYSGGKYTLTNPSTISDWSTNYQNYIGYYTCSSSTTSSCSEVEYMVKTTSYDYTYMSLKNGLKGDEEIIFGNDVTYSGGTYTLIDTIGVKAGEWYTKYNSINNNHYTCFKSGTTCSSVMYLYYAVNNGYHYINISNGKKIEDVLNDVFSNNVNSTAKSSVDSWYRTNLNSYTSKIEDTIYCNDRSISSLGGWDPDGGDTTQYLYYSPSNRLANVQNLSLACTRNLDRFTVSSSIGNGKLTYPVGLITTDEAVYAGGTDDKSNNKYYLYTNRDYWTMSPYKFDFGLNAGVNYVIRTGDFHNISVKSTLGIRPVISLSPLVTIQGGTDGTATNPYIVS